MIPQISPQVYQTGFNYLTFGVPPIETISIKCEFCGSHELVIIDRKNENIPGNIRDIIKGVFSFYCPYCFHIESVTIESVVIKSITMKDIVESLEGSDRDPRT